MTAMRCEGCGYSLDGLEFDAVCPECARPVALSRPGRRQGSPWQRHPSASTLLFTGVEMLTHPEEFWDEAQVEFPRSWHLLITNVAIASAIVGGAVTVHPIGAIVLGAPVFVVLFLVTMLAGAVIRLMTPGVSIGVARTAVAHAAFLWIAAALPLGFAIMLRLPLLALVGLVPVAGIGVIGSWGARRLRYVTPDS